LRALSSHDLFNIGTSLQAYARRQGDLSWFCKNGVTVRVSIGAYASASQAPLEMSSGLRPPGAIKSIGQFTALLCSEGACENSPAFQCRVGGSKACIRPEGTAEGKECSQSSLRDENPFSRLPGVETPGYCRMSLRDRASDMHARRF
jgi:hypothetical protein